MLRQYYQLYHRYTLTKLNLLPWFVVFLGLGLLPYITTALPIICEYEQPPEGALDLIAFMPTTSNEKCQRICQLAVDCDYYRFVADQGLCLLSESPLSGGGIPSSVYLGGSSSSSSASASATSSSTYSTSTSSSLADCTGSGSASSSADADSQGSGGSASTQTNAHVTCTNGGSDMDGQGLNQPEYGKEFLGEDISESFRVQSAIDCQTICDLVSGCGYYTYMTIKSDVSLCWLMSTAYNVGPYYEGIQQYGYLFDDAASTAGQSTGPKSQPNQRAVTEQLLDELTCKRPQYYYYVREPVYFAGGPAQSTSMHGASLDIVANMGLVAKAGSNQCYLWGVNCGQNGYGWRFVRDEWKCYGDHLCNLLGYNKKWKCKYNCLE